MIGRQVQIQSSKYNLPPRHLSEGNRNAALNPRTTEDTEICGFYIVPFEACLGVGAALFLLAVIMLLFSECEVCDICKSWHDGKGEKDAAAEYLLKSQIPFVKPNLKCHFKGSTCDLKSLRLFRSLDDFLMMEKRICDGIWTLLHLSPYSAWITPVSLMFETAQLRKV